MRIRKGKKSDLQNIMKMYNSCVKGMIKNGIDQWDESYPNAEIISEDLNMMTYYVAEIKEENESIRDEFSGEVRKIKEMMPVTQKNKEK